MPTVDVTTNGTVSNICEKSQSTVTVSSQSKSDKTLLKKTTVKASTNSKKRKYDVSYLSYGFSGFGKKR